MAVVLFAGCQEKDAASAGRDGGNAAGNTITTKTGIEMVLCPAGEFAMGDDAGDEDERPAHTVRVAALYMDKHEVTQKAYESLTGMNPSRFKGPDRPVERVSWTSAAKYCNLRSLREGFRSCYDAETLACDFGADGYRLPTEAEWEYVCRAGTKAAYSFGGDPVRLGEFAWFKANANDATHPGGQKRPNPWGLHDMHGNVAEWCNDAYGEGYYQERQGADPRGPATGEKRVLRGGSWRSGADRSGSAARAAEPPGFADVCFGYEAYGFRCVRRAAK